ncbi:MAG: HmuY family protein [Gemmatimonadaceae bacterium]
MVISLPRERATIVLAVALALFVSVLGYLIVSSLGTRSAAEFAPTTPGRALHAAAVRANHARGVDTLTLDARDEKQWRFATLREGVVLLTPDTAGWELATRRHHIIASGGLADLGAVHFDSVSRAPANGYQANTVSSDTTNAATNHWYRYGMLSHLLEPNGHVFALRTSDGGYFKFDVLSYYCPGLQAGCLTIRFAALPSP